MDKEQFYKEFFRYLECGSCADLEFCQKQLEPACKNVLVIYSKLKLEDLEKENEQLKKQLAEKDKEYNSKCIYEAKFRKTLGNWQNQTAIAELNNILDTFAIFVNEEKESMVSPDGNGNLSLLEYIENRIDTLKGE